MVINRKFRKPPAGKNADMTNHLLDLNIVEHAKQVKEFIDSIKKVVDKDGLTYVFWIHGIKNENITPIDPDAECLIGYGQPDENQEPLYTAKQETINKLIETFKNHNIKAIEAPPDSIYKGYDVNRMNQWFRTRYSLEQVQSIQLEFKYTGIRATESLDSAARSIAQAIKATTEEDVMTEVDTQEIEQSPVDKAVPAQDTEQVQSENAPDAQDKDDIPDAEVVLSKEEKKSDDTKPAETNIEDKVSENLPATVKKGRTPKTKTAKAMSEAIKNAIPTPPIIPEVIVQTKAMTEDEKVETAYNRLKEIFAVNFYNTLVKAGNYLIETFFEGEHKKAESMKSNTSLNKLFIRLNKETAGNAPKKSWLYDSIKIAMFDKKYSVLFPNLETTVCTSHKLKLISSGFDEELQLQLLHEVQEKQYTVMGLARRINELRGKPESSKVTVTKPDFTSFLKSLQTVSGDTLKELFEDNELIEMKTQLQAEIDKITAVLEPQQEEVPATPPATVLPQ